MAKPDKKKPEVESEAESEAESEYVAKTKPFNELPPEIYAAAREACLKELEKPKQPKR